MDTIFYNGLIRTMAGRTATALAVQKGRIALVGTDDEVLPWAKEDTKIIDLKGRCVLPGFVDSHMHFLHTGMLMRKIDLRGVESAEEIVARGKAYLASHTLAPDEWVVGFGFNHHTFAQKVLPDCAIAEAISTTHPVLLDRVCGHVGTGNKKALALAGYDENTTVVGGHLEKYPDGTLNGIVHEGALDRLKSCIPRTPQGQLEEILVESGILFAKSGLTTIHSDDMGPEGTTWEALRGAADALIARDAMPVRIWQEWEAPRPPQLQKVIDMGITTGSGDSWLCVANIKLMGDGSLGARTAALRSPYCDDPDSCGILVYTQEEMDEMVALCHKADLQVACHAIGDGCCEQFISAVEKVMAADPKPLHHRIVHCQIGDEGLYRRMAAAGIACDIQPPFTYTDEPLVAPRLGERGKTCYAWKTLLDCGVVLGGGSDSPIEDFSPLWGIHCAVNRNTSAGGVWMPEQCLTVEEAVALYTTGPARMVGDCENSGTLEAGKRADLVVLGEDIFTIDPKTIKDTPVTLTMVGGRITYQGD